MRKILHAAAVVWLASMAVAEVAAQSAAPGTLVRQVRAAVACSDWPCTPKQDFSEGEAILAAFRAEHGATSEALEALSWLGRAALAGNQLDKAYQYAMKAYDESVAALKDRQLDKDPRLEAALGASIEVLGHVRAGRGERSTAVYLLQRELDTYRGTVLEMRIQKNLNLLSMEGERAPALTANEHVGRAVPTFEDLNGKVVLLFFWAHWCGDCKAQAPVMAKLLDRYRSRGLTIVAPTQRYGFTLKRGETAAPDAELQRIVQVRDEYYAFLRDEAVPLDQANHRRYGVSTTPTLALVDRSGIVRLYHPGGMTEEELEAAIVPLLGTPAGN
jgi:thiol-disulfide isomerase/thioredoxin